MAFANAQKSRLLLGSIHLSGYARGFNFDATTDMLDVTTLLDTAKVSMPGMDTATGQIDMHLDVDSTSNGQFDQIGDWKATAAQPITFGQVGISVGDIVFMGSALETQFTVSSPLAGVHGVSVSTQLDGASDPGVVLETLTAVTVDGNGTARDNGAASSNGGVAHLHVTAFSGLTSNVVTIEHSVDGSTSWATLVTFATYTAITSERVVVAPGTTVRRYLRVVDDVTGTGTTTRAVTFARR